jgi:ribonuclease BN (tRNA processing enzyme)
MKIRILGAHTVESDSTGCSSLLIDDIMAVDAGALTSGLSFAEQEQLQAVLLTHQHYDHIRGIPALGMNLYNVKRNIVIYSTTPVYEALSAHLLNNILYPDFLKRPPGKPTMRFVTVAAGKAETIAGYEVLPVPVNHAVPTVGFRITSPDGKQVFITSDTGPGLSECWKQISPQLLIIELTWPNKYEESALRNGHLTPALLHKELESFRALKSYLPQVVVTHINPPDEKDIKAEISLVEKELGIKIRFAREGMTISV